MRGEGHAFDRVFRLYFPALSFFACQLLGEREAAEDLAQEVLIKLWQRRSQLAMVQDLRSYLYVMTRNQCSDWIRSRNKQEGAAREAETDLLTEQNIEQALIRAETIRELHRVIALLPARMQQVFRLYYLEGKSTREISQLMQTSVHTVINQRKTALRLIRKTFIPDR